MSLHIPRSPNSRICARNDAVGFHHACSLAAGRHLATEPPILLADRPGDRGACTSRRQWRGWGASHLPMLRRQSPMRSARASRKRPTTTGRHEVAEQKSNHRHGKIVCGRKILHTVNNFHEAADAGLRGNGRPSVRPGDLDQHGWLERQGTDRR